MNLLRFSVICESMSRTDINFKESHSVTSPLAYVNKGRLTITNCFSSSMERYPINHSAIIASLHPTPPFPASEQACPGNKSYQGHLQWKRHKSATQKKSSIPGTYHVTASSVLVPTGSIIYHVAFTYLVSMKITPDKTYCFFSYAN